MKKVILFLSVVILLLCTTTCDSEEKNKGRFKKNIPECIKQQIKDQSWIIRAEEYCSIDNTKKIYIIFGHPSSTVCLIGYDEHCNDFVVKSDEYNCNPNDPDCWVWGEILPDGTIEYDEDIYNFKRIIFTQK